MTLAPAPRKLALAVHLTVSIGWIGAIAAYVALDLASARSSDLQTLRTAYLGMELISRNVIVPLAIASLVTGLVVSLGTKWGLFRHYWVVISLVMTAAAVIVLLVERGVISAYADVAADPSSSADDLRALASTLPHSIGGMAVLLVVLVLNIYKPAGLTRYGWRRQQELTRRQRPASAARITAPAPAAPIPGSEPANRSRDPDAATTARPGPDKPPGRSRGWAIALAILISLLVLALLVALHAGGAVGPGAD
jgi:hypothetical protein